MTTTNAANSSPITAGDAGDSLTTAADVAAFIERKADDYAREHGVDDMGSLSFGNDAMRDYHWGLLELADEIRKLAAPQPQGGALTEMSFIKDWQETMGHAVPLTTETVTRYLAVCSSAPSAPQQAGGGLTVALRNELITQICEHTDSSRTWAESIVNNAVRKTRLLAAPRQPGEMGAGVDRDKVLDEVMQERDAFHEVADKLAAGIASHLTVDIGEHSSANCPWTNALEWIENPPAAVPASYKDSTPQLKIGDSSFESWYEQYAARLTGNPKQTARDAYAAGMGDPLVTAASAQQDEREAEWLTSKWCTVCKGATCLPGMHGLSEAVKQHVIAEFLQCTGQYVTNNASREAAIADAISKLPARTFEQAWAEKERQGYKYGNDALECVRMGWDMACASKPHAAQQVQANAGAVVPVAWMRRYHVAHEWDDSDPGFTGFTAISFHQNKEYAVEHPEENTPLYTRPAGESDKRDAEHKDVGRLLHKAAVDLPEGWEIQVRVERGWGGVVVHDEAGETTDLDDGESSLSEQIERAIGAAMSREQSQVKGGKHG